MRIELTPLAKTELNKLVKIQNELEQSESDIDLYFGFSSYDQLLFDMQMLEDGSYVENKFDDLNTFASNVSEGEGTNVEFVLGKINKAIELNLITLCES